MSQYDTTSFLEPADQADNIEPHKLSGDENAERSVLLSDISGKKANMLLTVTTIMKTVIGAGILSLPYTFSRLGFVTATLFLIFILIVIQFTSTLLLKSKNLSKHSNYSTIAFHIFRNRFAQTISSLAILINNLGICIVELTIFKGALRNIIYAYGSESDSPWVVDQFYTQTWFIVVILALLQVPFTLVKKIQKLKFMAFLGVAGITLFVIALIINFFVEMTEPARNWKCNSEVKAFNDDFLQIASVLPNIMLALGYHMNFFPIFKGLKDGTDEKMTKASLFGLLGCAFFYFLVGSIGYCIYGREVKGNFLLNFDKNDINEGLFIILNFGFLVSVFFSFPVMFFGARNNFIAITKTIVLMCQDKKEGFQPVSKDTVEEISSYIKIEDRQKKKKRAQVLFYIFTFILYAIAIGIAIGVDDIEDVFNIIGAIASNMISFLLPSLFYWVMVKRKNKEKKAQYYGAWAVFILFIPLGIFAVVSNIITEREHQN